MAFYAACTVALCAGMGQAAEVTGGSVDLGYSFFADETDVAKFNLSGSAEVGFTRSFATQFDAAIYDFGLINETGYMGALHAILHSSENLSLGAYVGVDSVNSADVTFYGVEAGYEFDAVDVEGYVGALDPENSAANTATQLGLLVRGDVTDNLELIGKLDHLDDLGGVDITRFSVGADYTLSPGAEIYGEIGTADLSLTGVSDSEPFIGLGLRLAFGAKRGATFGRRGLLDKMPGL